MWTYFADRKLIRIKRYKVNDQVVRQISHPDIKYKFSNWYYYQIGCTESSLLIGLYTLETSWNWSTHWNVCFEPRNKFWEPFLFVALYITMVTIARSVFKHSGIVLENI